MFILIIYVIPLVVTKTRNGTERWQNVPSHSAYYNTELHVDKSSSQNDSDHKIFFC